MLPMCLLTTLSPPKGETVDNPGSTTHVAAVEAGGTKFRAAVFSVDPGADAGAPRLEMLDEVRVSTTTPDETLSAIERFFDERNQPESPPIASLGIASFGPLIVDRQAENYGSIAATPKPHWSGAPLLQRLADHLGVPAQIQTDVEAAAVAEHQLGAGVGYDSVAYVTVGTGIGVGVLVDGAPFRGRDHLEIGHIPVQRGEGDDFVGVCPFHSDCLEGMASGPAIHERWGTNPSSLDARDDVWELEADYLAQLATVVTWAFSPDRILFSGGVGARAHLEPRIQAATKRRLAGYSVSHAENSDLVATAALGNEAGLFGAALLAASLL